jgi:hypothetical protein
LNHDPPLLFCPIFEWEECSAKNAGGIKNLWQMIASVGRMMYADGN